MRKAAFLLLIPLVLPKLVFSQNITTGDASAKSTVINEVSGNSNVYTKIEVTANGEKKTLETTEPGEHSLEITSNSESSTEASVDSDISIEEGNDKDLDGKDEAATGSVLASFIKELFSGFADFFKNILSFF